MIWKFFSIVEIFEQGKNWVILKIDDREKPTFRILKGGTKKRKGFVAFLMIIQKKEKIFFVPT